MPYEKQIRAERNRQFIDIVERLRIERGITKAEMYKGIGGWSDPGTMRKIYRHLAAQDKNAAAQKMAAFYAACENGNENGNDTKKP